MEFPMRSLYAASLGIGIVAGLAGCSISTTPAPSPPVVVQAPPAATSGTVVTPGSAVVVQPPRY
mgnify:FL=1